MELKKLGAKLRAFFLPKQITKFHQYTSTNKVTIYTYSMESEANGLRWVKETTKKKKEEQKRKSRRKAHMVHCVIQCSIYIALLPPRNTSKFKPKLKKKKQKQKKLCLILLWQSLLPWDAIVQNNAMS